MTDYGAVALILFLVFRFITDFRKRKTECATVGTTVPSVDLHRMADDIARLRQAHEAVDASGVPLLNVRPLLDKQMQFLETVQVSVDRMDKHLQEHTKLLTEMVNLLRKGTE